MGTSLALRQVEEEAIAPLQRVHSRALYLYRVAKAPLGGVPKRLFDLVVAGAALVLLSPLLLLVAGLIRLDSPGPALYRQHRTGFRGRTFMILKFRTMRTMEDGRACDQAQPDDARVTRLGRVLRRTSIDELPQLVNVIRGHMSLVGPRPHAVKHDHEFYYVDARYPRRFMARPGITGAAQIAGARGVTDTSAKVAERLRLDLNYIDDWSFWRDIAILLATTRVLFDHRNAC